MISVLLRNLWVVLLLVAVVAVPIALRRGGVESGSAQDTLVIITPHNEATRFEFERGFQKHYRARTGRTVSIDWRTPGGTSEISRYLTSQYHAAFQLLWTRELGQPWIREVESAFDNAKTAPGDDTPGNRARKAFLNSDVSSGVDLFFGGGTYEFTQLAGAGQLVDSGVLSRHPEWFGEGAIPQTRGGEEYYDPEGRWVGACLSAFGICYNVDSLRRLGIGQPPTQWSELARPVYRGEIALADPTQSGSVAKAFEMLIQQQMLRAVAESADPAVGVSEGWRRGLEIIQRAGANARYFTDSSSKIPWDVQAGDAAAGMCIDFYGRFQSEAVRHPDGSSRLLYAPVPGGSSVGADPIAQLRGAPHPETARAFIDFVLSEAGQKLWNFRVGTPGGPTRYALRRQPIRPALYRAEFRRFAADPDSDPYAQAAAFEYHGEWTGRLFRTMGFVIRAMSIETHSELAAAWAALIEADFPPAATAQFSDLSFVDYPTCQSEILPILRGSAKVDEVRLAKRLSDRFRANYLAARDLAEAGR